MIGHDQKMWVKSPIEWEPLQQSGGVFRSTLWTLCEGDTQGEIGSVHYFIKLDESVIEGDKLVKGGSKLHFIQAFCDGIQHTTAIWIFAHWPVHIENLYQLSPKVQNTSQLLSVFLE